MLGAKFFFPRVIQGKLRPLVDLLQDAVRLVQLIEVVCLFSRNAAVLWNRIPAEQTHYFDELYKPDGILEQVDEWTKFPLDDSREKEFRAKHPEILMNLRLYRDMARAARFESCDW